MSEDWITRYTQMPIPPLDAHTEYFEAGPISIGVEYRLLDDAIAAAHQLDKADGRVAEALTLEDRGVSLHVFGAGADGNRVEYLRFDCFDEDPHYHYVSWARKSNEMIHIDKVADGDPLAWALDRIRTRLPQMLARAGAGELAARVDAPAIERVLPRVAEAAWRARFHHDDASIHRDAVHAGARQRAAS
jgi:hypothetical protein